MSASSDVSETDLLVLVSDDDYEPDVIIISSDDESEHDAFSDDADMLDDFQLFALIDPVEDHAPLEDDFLALLQPLHDVIIYGHPNGEHMIVHLAVPLAADPFADLDEDDVFVPVIHVEHLEDELGDGEVIDDIAILVLPSPIISVVDISSSPSAAESE
ncbi:hypothetical protein Hanom_Chr06g00540301 [Helianthus anomalus]